MGTILTYGERARHRAEVFEAEALAWPDDGVVLNRQHDRRSPIMRIAPEVRGAAVVVDVALPDTAAAVVNRYAPDAPPRSAEEAVLRTATYLSDATPTIRREAVGPLSVDYAIGRGGGDSYMAAFRNSGAMSLLNPFKVRRAGAFSDEDLGPELAEIQDDTTIRWRLSDGTTRTLWNSNS